MLRGYTKVAASRICLAVEDLPLQPALYCVPVDLASRVVYRLVRRQADAREERLEVCDRFDAAGGEERSTGRGDGNGEGGRGGGKVGALEDVHAHRPVRVGEDLAETIHDRLRQPNVGRVDSVHSVGDEHPFVAAKRKELEQSSFMLGRATRIWNSSVWRTSVRSRNLQADSTS